MPIYAYRHVGCGWNAVIRDVSVADRVLNACPQCHENTELRPLLNREHSPFVMLPAVTNQQYNNGMGRYDPGLGKWIGSRKEHRDEMKRQGVTEYTGSYEDFMDVQKREPAGISMETVKDAYEEATARVNRGEVFVDTPNPSPQLTPNVLTPEA